MPAEHTSVRLIQTRLASFTRAYFVVFTTNSDRVNASQTLIHLQLSPFLQAAFNAVVCNSLNLPGVDDTISTGIRANLFQPNETCRGKMNSRLLTLKQGVAGVTDSLTTHVIVLSVRGEDTGYTPPPPWLPGPSPWAPLPRRFSPPPLARRSPR